MCLVLILTALSAAIGSVQAAGTNQNDINSGTDLPNTHSIAPTMSLNGMSPLLFWYPDWGTRVGDDQDWFAVTLNPMKD